uniref:Uncharacterized protein n=1 Tax=Schistocephalus solidus TaxID=70667 RepID=A0A0X3PJC7_SCHSO
MGISFIGLAFGILAVIGIAVLIYFCCCRKKGTGGTSAPSEPTPAPVYPPSEGFQPVPPGAGSVGWNVSQPPGISGPGAPYPTEPMSGAPIGSAWGQARPPYPPPPGAPQSYPSAPPPYPG